MTLEPGDAGAIIAEKVRQWLLRQVDVVVRPGGLETRQLTPEGQTVAWHEEPGLTADLIHTAIKELANGAEIPKEATWSRKVTLSGQEARLVLSPWAGLFGGAGPDIYYRWLPN